MKTLYKIGIGFVLLMIISASMLFLLCQILHDTSYTSHYSYDVMLTTDSPLSNITLCIPLPMINNTSSVGTDIVEHNFNKDDPSWKYTLVDTEHGLMLSMKKNGKIEPKHVWPPIIDLSTMVSSNQTIDTMNPLGKEMVLMPKYNLTYLGSASSQPDASDYFNYENAKVYNYDSRIYAHYETLPNTKVSISIYLSGYNQWRIGGWLFNNFREEIPPAPTEIKLSGPQDGWITINGKLVTGEGTYERPFSLS